MKYKILMMAIVIFGIILSGCIGEKTIKENKNDTKILRIKYIEDGNVITKEDFPDFDVMHKGFFVSQENTSLTLRAETGHRTFLVDASEKIPAGFKIYGASEAYNSTYKNKTSQIGRYILMQFKVFDNDENLEDSMNMTVYEYTKSGFRTKSINKTYKGRVIVLESELNKLLNNQSVDNKSVNNKSVSNRSDGSGLNNLNYTSDINVTIILFGFDTIIGKIGVQDTKDISLNESLKILDLAYERIVVRTKDVKAANIFRESMSTINTSINYSNY